MISSKSIELNGSPWNIDVFGGALDMPLKSGV